jgi:hypothetical protein
LSDGLFGKAYTVADFDMLIADVAANVPPWMLGSAAAGIIFLRAASFRYQKGLNKYKGPILASFTNFWRLWQWLWYWDRTYFLDLVKYGKIIRVGPDTLLFNDPEAIKDIYTTGFSKVGFRSLTGSYFSFDKSVTKFPVRLL